MRCDKKTGRLYTSFVFVFAFVFVFVFETDEAVAGGGRLYIYNSGNVLFPLENTLKVIDMLFVLEGVLFTNE